MRWSTRSSALAADGGTGARLAGADALLPHMTANLLTADRAFDADRWVLDPLAAGQIRRNPASTKPLDAPRFDRKFYQARHLIENFFRKLKQFRAIATR
jgi:transposase